MGRMKELKKWDWNFKILMVLFYSLGLAASFNGMYDLANVAVIGFIAFSLVFMFNALRIKGSMS